MTAEASTVPCPSCGSRNRVPAAAAGSPRCAVCKQALPRVVEADEGSFDEVAGTGSLSVIVDLWAPWCGPCRAVSPVLEQLAGELAGRWKVVKVNVDEAPRIQARFGVRAVPTLIALRHGREIGRRVGAAPLGVLRAWMEESLNPAA